MVRLAGDRSMDTTLTNYAPRPQANLPNLRRLFVEARTEAEENEYSRTAVRLVDNDEWQALRLRFAT
ncbi:hypothetical protein BDW42DRAFT_4720 [Aspergillus taichungensis]|uniref:Uncharacterized protein n=1 Tax=Aspergillus taichungensis TaxID=482145 RepID=A0A2J5HJR4_9EURO|nr:hypothetical protein BDW42DRAFT_4720 [Aspergillus taichungensis]